MNQQLELPLPRPFDEGGQLDIEDLIAALTP